MWIRIGQGKSENILARRLKMKQNNNKNTKAKSPNRRQHLTNSLHCGLMMSVFLLQSVLAFVFLYRQDDLALFLLNLYYIYLKRKGSSTTSPEDLWLEAWKGKPRVFFCYKNVNIYIFRSCVFYAGCYSYSHRAVKV